MANVSVTANKNYLLISDGNAVIYSYKTKIAVRTDDGNNVIIHWDRVNKYTSNYANFLTPSGATAVAVATAIAALL